MAELNPRPYQLDRRCRGPSTYGDLLSDRRSQGTGIRGKQDAGWARRGADDCMNAAQGRGTSFKQNMRPQTGSRVAVRTCWDRKEVAETRCFSREIGVLQ